MFNKKEKQKPDFENVGTLLGEGIEFSDGNIKGCGNVQINGILFGDVDIDGSLIVGDTGYIKGNISATYAKIGGRLDGNSTIIGVMHLTEHCNVQGDVECGSIVIEENAVFCGLCQMTGKSEKRKARNNDNTDDNDSK